MKLSGARILMECLLEQGVDTVFGYPGATVVHIYDELYRYSKKIRHIMTSHEQSAAHAADGYARATGKTGVCFATSGPGATNLITGIAAAYMDSSPVVFITGNVNSSLIGRDAFQEVDISSISMPVTKNNYIVKDISTLADVVREAFLIASSGRPGPVLIDIPKNITEEKANFEPLHLEVSVSETGCVKTASAIQKQLYAALDDDDLNVLVKLIQESTRPMILAGGGVIRSSASESLHSFSERINAPVACTLMGVGSFPSDHPSYFGLIGMHGAKKANLASEQCDLLIAIGVRFSDRVAGAPDKFAPHAKIIHIDIDRAEINKNVIVNHHITGDAKIVLDALLEKLRNVTISGLNVPPPVRLNSATTIEINSTITANTDSVTGSTTISEITSANKTSTTMFSPQNIFRRLQAQTDEQTILVTDVGQHQLWTAQYYHFQKPNTFITSGGFGAMGFGLGAAIGASIGQGENKKQIIHITGDGSFRMNLTELSTVTFYNLPIISIIFNNGTLGMVRQWQRLFFNKRYAYTDLNRGPDFMKLADAYALNGYRVSDLNAFDKALTQAFRSQKATVIECLLQKDEPVTPMVAPGACLTEFIRDKLD